MKFLVIYDCDGEIKCKFPVNHIMFEVDEFEGVIRVSHYDTHYTFRLDRYDYAIENSQRVEIRRAEI